MLGQKEKKIVSSTWAVKKFYQPVWAGPTIKENHVIKNIKIWLALNSNSIL